MKKVLATLMLFIMLIVGVGPTLGMHFCGNQFHSVQLDVSEMPKTCCPQPADEQATQDNCVSFHKNCCQTKEVQLSTDNYQIQDRPFNVVNILPSFNSMWIVFNYVGNLVSPNLVEMVDNDYPPEGYDVKNLDILTFICILRI